MMNMKLTFFFLTMALLFTPANGLGRRHAPDWWCNMLNNYTSDCGTGWWFCAFWGRVYDRFCATASPTTPAAPDTTTTSTTTTTTTTPATTLLVKFAGDGFVNNCFDFCVLNGIEGNCNGPCTNVAGVEDGTYQCCEI